jgi:hypothetical protein
VRRTKVIKAIAVAAASLILIGGCGGSANTSPTERAAELREAQAKVEGELLLVKVEEGAAEYDIARAAGKTSSQHRALQEVEHAAHACWEFGIEECSEMPAIEDKVEALEADVHHRLIFTH